MTTEPIVKKAHDNIMFGKAERLAAGICMGIPFFLLVGNNANRALWYFPLLALIFILLPHIIVRFIKRSVKEEHNYGLFLTILIGFVLVIFYLLFIQAWGYESLSSISLYVTMRDSYIFGLLLTTGAMLFMANGLFYWSDSVANRDGRKFRAINNFWLGLFLFGVVIFPCVNDLWQWFHYICALLFFGGCALASVFRSKGKHHKRKHQITDYATATLMVGSFVVPLLRGFKMIPSDTLPWINIFGAESIGLWVIGIDFILVSLDREPMGNY
jgi:hypothetical protein